LIGEVASVTNEILLFYYLIKKAEEENDIELKILVINYYCDELKG
jgi:oligoendopeptidase F